MSDINEIITESMNRAFNAGKKSGELTERNRILTIAQKISFENWKGHDLISLQDLEEYVNEQDK